MDRSYGQRKNGTATQTLTQPYEHNRHTQAGAQLHTTRLALNICQ